MINGKCTKSTPPSPLICKYVMTIITEAYFL